MIKDKTVKIRLSSEELAMFKAICEAYNVSMSEFVRTAINDLYPQIENVPTESVPTKKVVPTKKEVVVPTDSDRITYGDMTNPTPKKWKLEVLGLQLDYGYRQDVIIGDK